MFCQRPIIPAPRLEPISNQVRRVLEPNIVQPDHPLVTAIGHKRTMLMPVLLHPGPKPRTQRITNPADRVTVILVTAKSDAKIDIQCIKTLLEVFLHCRRITRIPSADALNTNARVNSPRVLGFHRQGSTGEKTKGALLTQFSNTEPQSRINPIPNKSLGIGKRTRRVNRIDQPLMIRIQTGCVTASCSQTTKGKNPIAVKSNVR